MTATKTKKIPKPDIRIGDIVTPVLGSDNTILMGHTFYKTPRGAHLNQDNERTGYPSHDSRFLVLDIQEMSEPRGSYESFVIKFKDTKTMPKVG